MLVSAAFYPFLHPGPTRGSGVTTLIKNKDINVSNSHVVYEGHILYHKIELNNTTYHVLIPQENNPSLAALRALFNHCGKMSDGIMVVGGDLNCTENPSIYRLYMPTEHRPKVATALKDVCNFYDTCDVWRRLNYSEQKYTWLRNNTNNINGVSKARLDRFYVPRNLVSCIRSCDIKPCSLSDHTVVSLAIKLPVQKRRGSAYWHFNNSLLEDKNYKDIITKFWTNWSTKQNKFPNICVW